MYGDENLIIHDHINWNWSWKAYWVWYL